MAKSQMLDTMLDVLLAIVFFTALFGVIITSLNGTDWSALNVAGTVRDFSFAPYVIVLLIVVVLIYGVYKHYHK